MSADGEAAVTGRSFEAEASARYRQKVSAPSATG
jgi:hypothetical protein